MSGSMVLSSSCPHWAPTVTATWSPMTCAPTWMTASQMTGLTLPGMMLEPGCTAGSAQLGQPAARARVQEPHVVGDLHQAGRHRVERAAGPGGGVLRALRLEVVGRLAELRAGRARQRRPPRAPRELRVGVEPGAHRRAAEGQLAQVGQHGLEARDAVLDLRRVARELLPQPDGRGVHQVGARRS